MATNEKTIPKPLLDRLVRGLQADQGEPLIERIKGDPITVDSQEGTITVDPSDQVTARDEGAEVHKKDVGDDIELMDDQYDQTDYQIVSYAKGTIVEDRILQHVESVTGQDEMRRKMSRLRRDIFTQLNADLDSELDGSGSKNKQYDATTTGATSQAWSNSSAAVFDDVDRAIDKVPDNELIMVIGHDDQRDLKRNSNVLAEFSNFDAGSLGDGQLANIFRNKFTELDAVVMGNNIWSNSNPEGVSGVSLQHEFNRTWIGSPRGILWMDMGDSPEMRQQREEGKAGGGVTELYFERQHELKRPTELSELGVEIKTS